MGARGGDAEIAFREDYDLLAGDVILFKGFADYFFGAAVGVDVSLEASKEWLASWKNAEERSGGRDTVSHVFRPTLYACSRRGRECSSSRIHSCHSGEP